MGRAEQEARRNKAREMYATGQFKLVDIAKTLKVGARQVSIWKGNDSGTIHDWDKLKDGAAKMAQEIITESQVEKAVFKEANTRHQTTIDQMIELRKEHMEDYAKRTKIIKGLTMKALINKDQMDINKEALDGLLKASQILEKTFAIDRKNLGLDLPVIQTPSSQSPGSDPDKDVMPVASSFQQRVAELNKARGGQPSDPKVVEIAQKLRQLNQEAQ